MNVKLKFGPELFLRLKFSWPIIHPTDENTIVLCWLLTCPYTMDVAFWSHCLIWSVKLCKSLLPNIFSASQTLIHSTSSKIINISIVNCHISDNVKTKCGRQSSQRLDGNFSTSVSDHTHYAVIQSYTTVSFSYITNLNMMFYMRSGDTFWAYFNHQKHLRMAQHCCDLSKMSAIKTAEYYISSDIVTGLTSSNHYTSWCLIHMALFLNLPLLEINDF